MIDRGSRSLWKFLLILSFEIQKVCVRYKCRHHRLFWALSWMWSRLRIYAPRRRAWPRTWGSFVTGLANVQKTCSDTFVEVMWPFLRWHPARTIFILRFEGEDCVFCLPGWRTQRNNVLNRRKVSKNSSRAWKSPFQIWRGYKKYVGKQIGCQTIFLISFLAPCGGHVFGIERQENCWQLCDVWERCNDSFFVMRSLQCFRSIFVIITYNRTDLSIWPGSCLKS